MKKKFKKIKWKRVLSAALALLLVAGAIAGIAVIAGKKTKTISSFAFGRGAIDAEGNHIETDQCIYTEDLFECQGLTIVPDYEASGTYQVFYYSSNEKFMGSTEKIDANDGMYEKGETFFDAKYARIVISPNFKGDGDSKVRFYNVASYANDYTITVNKKQNFVPHNYYKLDTDMVGYAYFVDDSTGALSSNATVGYYASEWFDAQSGITFKVGMKDNFEGVQNFMFVYKLSNGKYVTGLHKQLIGECTDKMIWVDIPIQHEVGIESVALMVQDCTGHCPDVVIERV